MVKPILQFNEPVLNKPTVAVKDFGSPELKALVQDLVDTADKNKPITAGLAAPQLGVSLSVCVCRRVDLEHETDDVIPKDILWEVMINPKILNGSRDTSIYWEGCLSVGFGKASLFGPVERINKLTVSYFDAQGTQKSREFSDFFAHEVQHEMDHLNGIIFLKYITNPANIWKRNDLDKYYEENDGYPEIV